MNTTTWTHLLVSLLIVVFGVLGARALSQIDADLQILYREYTLAAVELAHISSDVLRYRITIVRAVESSSKKEFEELTASFAEQRANIQHAVDRYAAASLRVSRSGRSEPQDLEAVRQSLDAYFSSASKTMTLLIERWNAPTPAAALEFQRLAELHAADNAGPKLIQVSLALDHLLETITEVAKDLRDEGTQTVRQTSTVLVVLAVAIALLNLAMWSRRQTTPPQPKARPRDGHAYERDGEHTIQKSLPAGRSRDA